jgi:hypothetical protein
MNVGSGVAGSHTTEPDAAGPYLAGGAARIAPTGAPVLERVVWG